MKAFPIAAATVRTPITQKSAATQSGATQTTNFHRALRIATSGLSVTPSSADAKDTQLAASNAAAQQAPASDAPSLPAPIAATEKKLSTDSATLAALKNNPAPDETTEGTADLAVTPATLFSAASKSATPKSMKGVHPAADSSRAGKVTAAPPENSQQFGISTQLAISTPAETVVSALDVGTSSALAQQQAETSAPSVTSLSPQQEAAPDASYVMTASAVTAAASGALLTPIATSTKSAPKAAAPSVATNLAEPPAATQKTGDRFPAHGDITAHATRGIAPEEPGATSLEQAGARIAAHSKAFPPEASGTKATHSTHVAETKSATPQASHANQMRPDATTAPASSAQDQDARTSSPEHDATTSLEPITHAALLQAPATAQTDSPQITTAQTSQSAILQSAAAIPAVAAHTLPGSAAPGATAQSPTQSSSTAEPPHTIDTAQLRVQGNQSELKVSVQLPELGKVEVRAVSTHDATTAHVTAFRHDAIPVLTAERGGLEEALRSHNVILGSVGSQSQGHASPQQRQQSSHTPEQSSTASENATAATTVEALYPGFLPDHASISVRA